ncbi:S24 family peptidase [uncultured Duncaniella sp.]|uniref:S24 family peptidase n=1 Tax=uncultured Duncaniella sp. TaxID=2768039 RepID=UPI0025A93409|nr:S24 family peptidase [uncultured Duncaniella sp.]
MCKILSRINQIAENEDITIATIEKLIGASRGVISKAIKNGTDIQSKWLSLICDNFPMYSPEWILTGHGNMIKHNETILSSNPSDQKTTRPRIPFEAAAGSLSMITQSVTEAQCEQIPIVPGFPAYDFTIIVKGDSMEPEFHSGDELACKILRQSSFIQWGRPYIVDCLDGVVLKRIHDAGDDILCTSDNKNYGDFKIPKREVNHLAIVVGMMRLF